MHAILFSWLGKTDLKAVTESNAVGSGPIAQALATGRFARLHLICDCPEDQAAPYLAWLAGQAQGGAQTPVTPHYVELPGPTDFGAIYRAARAVVAAAHANPTTEYTSRADGRSASLDPPDAEQRAHRVFHLSPGTPAMAAVWIILAKTRFPAELIESSLQHGVRTASVPFDIAADFLPDLLARPDATLARLAAGLPPAAPEFDAIVHRGPAMQRAIARARRVAPRAIPVLIEGESGTGKELLARAIHRASPRRERPFVTVNCGAIAPELIESELFGHEKGAFTGATAPRKGYFEAAHTGTLFLDEIGELPKPAQVKLLRALQEGEIVRVGATAATRIDVRILAATNRTLAQETAAGRFREDLFYRLAVAVIPLPALREREGDLSLLIDTLLEQVNRESACEPGYTQKHLSAAARNLLIHHPWPGNVRELLNTLRRAAVWTPAPTIDLEDARDALLPHPAPSPHPASDPAPASPPGDPLLAPSLTQPVDLKGIIDRVARHYLSLTLHTAAGNKTQAARLLGFGNPTTLTNWLKRHGLEP